MLYNKMLWKRFILPDYKLNALWKGADDCKILPASHLLRHLHAICTVSLIYDYRFAYNFNYVFYIDYIKKCRQSF